MRENLTILICLFLVLGCACQIGVSGADAHPSDSGDGVSATTEACNDGTGAADCCPSSTIVGGSCSSGISTCYSRCAFAEDSSRQGSRGEFSCPSGTWLAGHGLFPCMRQ